MAYRYGYGEKTDTIVDVLYEFLTNALDSHLQADLDSIPTFESTGNSITVSDSGNGLEEYHITELGADSSETDTKRHGGHGIGLKDAIACCVRKGWPLTIESRSLKYTFEKLAERKGINMVTSRSNVTSGTKITVTLSNAQLASDAVEKTKKNFLQFQGNLTKVKTKNGIDMYKKPRGEKGAVFIMGVRKDCPWPLQYWYNFVQPTVQQKIGVNRNHEFNKKSVKKLFRVPIEIANPDETFGVIASHSVAALANQMSRLSAAPSTPAPVMNVPRDVHQRPALPTPPQTAGAVVNVPRDVYQSMLHDVATHCTQQDYHVWTLTTDERDHLEEAHGKMATLLRQIPGVSVAETSLQGSLGKNTFVPLSSDIDIVLKINGYSTDTAADIARMVKDHLRSNGARLEDSGKRIVNCTFMGVAFDLVLYREEENNRMDAIRNANETYRQKMQSFIRAMKYWCKREGVAIKSCVIEEAIVSMWENDINGKQGVEAFKAFLIGVEEALLNPAIKDFYELSEESIEAIEDHASDAFDELP